MEYKELKKKVRMERDFYKEMHDGERDDKVKSIYHGMYKELEYILKWCERMEKQEG